MEELAPRELIANQYPGDEEAEHCVEKCCCKREAEAYPQRRQHARIAENIPQARGAERRRAQDQDREGKKDDEAEIGQRIGKRDGNPGIALGRRKRERIGCTSSSIRLMRYPSLAVGFQDCVEDTAVSEVLPLSLVQPPKYWSMVTSLMAGNRATILGCRRFGLGRADNNSSR